MSPRQVAAARYYEQTATMTPPSVITSAVILARTKRLVQHRGGRQRLNPEQRRELFWF